jgi:hypothetical protein
MPDVPQDRLPDGRVVIARQPATIPHPNTRKLVPYKGIDACLLEDETTVYQCRRAPDLCQRTAENPRSVVSHLRVHSDRQRRKPSGGSRLGPAVIGGAYAAWVIRLVSELLQTTADHDSRSAQFAAVARMLNERGVQTVSGRPWTRTVIHNMYYGRKLQTPRKAAVRKPGPASRPEPAKPKPAARQEEAVVPIPTELGPMLVYNFPLRPDLVVRLSLPADLTGAEAERFAGFVRSLAF